MNNEEIISEGFWHSKHAQHLPKVEARDQPFHEKGVIVNLMFLLESKLLDRYTKFMLNYNRQLVTTPLNGRVPLEQLPSYEEGTEAVPVVAYRGWSTCRICGCHNGSKEYVYGGYRWPEGYRHYVEEHNVEPSEGFKKMLTAAAERIVHPDVQYTIEAGIDGNVAGVRRMVSTDNLVALFIDLRCKRSRVCAIGSDTIDGKDVPIVYIDTLNGDDGDDTGVVLQEFAGWQVWSAQSVKYGINVCMMRDGALYNNQNEGANDAEEV